MTTMRTGLTVVLLASLVALTCPVAAAEPDASPAPTLPERVLFIGNSHTFSNGGIDWHLEQMAEASDPPIPFTADAETISGATLAIHYEYDSQGRIPYGDYDVVVIQGHIPKSPDKTTDSFIEYARLFDEIIRENGARTVFFMSWPHPDEPWIGVRGIARAHRQVADELGADVAPVANAMRKAHKKRPGLALLGPDGIHASWAGSYLAAAVIYATLFDRSPEGLSYTFGVSPEDAEFLQRIAWESVVNWRAGDVEAADGKG